MFLQLSLFFTITAISMWVDQLRNSEIAYLAEHPPLYYTLFVFTIVVRTAAARPSPCHLLISLTDDRALDHRSKFELLHLSRTR